ncbi:hypothetical protein [Paenibacillus thiaminolyticus]|nr:hypothetical protein [Paenibacillus thiaminolyticus]
MKRMLADRSSGKIWSIQCSGNQVITTDYLAAYTDYGCVSLNKI